MLDQAKTTLAKAEEFAAKEYAADGMDVIARLIRACRNPEGLLWIADNCEGQSKIQLRVDHAAQFSVIAKRLRRAAGRAA